MLHNANLNIYIQIAPRMSCFIFIYIIINKQQTKFNTQRVNMYIYVYQTEHKRNPDLTNAHRHLKEWNLTIKLEMGNARHIQGRSSSTEET